MWDSAGLERYRALIPSYVRGASIIFIIYDISSKESFDNLGTWINFIKQVNTDNSMVVLCGNKTDLERRITTQEGTNLTNKEQMLFFEVSAKNGFNINKMMYSCIAELPFFEQFQIGNKDELIMAYVDGERNVKIFDVFHKKIISNVKGLNHTGKIVCVDYYKSETQNGLVNYLITIVKIIMSNVDEKDDNI